MEQRNERVVLETARYRIEGELSLPREGYRSRITDFLNAEERGFLAIQEAVVEPLDGSGGRRAYPFLALARAHVVMVAPLEAPAADAAGA